MVHMAHAGDVQPLPYRDARARALEAFDRGYLHELLSRYHGNITHAAREAGKERRALARLLKRYALDAASFRSAAR
jgi:DNA-binding NtrC family response regulator